MEFNNIDMQNKLDYILKRIFDSKYYFSKYIQIYIMPKLKSVLEYYKTFLFISKRKDISILEEIINNKKKYEQEHQIYLEDFKISLKMNERYPIINYFMTLDKEKPLFNEETIKFYTNKWEILEKKIREKKLEELEEKDTFSLNTFFNLEKNQKIFIKIFNIELYNWLKEKIKDIKNKSNNTKCINLEKKTYQNNKVNEQYKNYSINDNQKRETDKQRREQISKKDYLSKENVGKNSNVVSSESIYNESFLISSIDINKINNYFNYENKEESSIDIIQNSSFDSKLKLFNYDTIKSYYINEFSKYPLIKLINFKSNDKSTYEFVKYIENQFILVYGMGFKNIINYYDYNTLSKLENEYIFYDIINNIEIEENDSIKGNNNKEILVCSKRNISKIITTGLKVFILDETNFNYIIKIDNSYIFCLAKKVIKMDFLNSKVLYLMNHTLFDGFYKEGIKLYNKLFAVTSNRSISNGEDKIKFYNLNNESTCLEIIGYSFILSTNGLYLISFNNNDKNQILLCACKKYIKGQKNGILLISNLSLISQSSQYDEKKYVKFFETGNFEVHCFCQLTLSKENLILKSPKSINKINYFFVGGFDGKRHKGSIKLYKIYEIEKDRYEIIEIKDIVIINHQFKGFKGPINCIEILNKETILVACWDGKLYIFKAKNLELLINKDENQTYFYSKNKFYK